jgi:hypothetical protein
MYEDKLLFLCFLTILLLGRHTGDAIKKHYDQTVKFYDISTNVFKIIADQGANVKKAFKETRECDNSDEIINLTKNMLDEQRKIDLKAKQDTMRIELEKEIEKANKLQDTNIDSRKRKREEVLNDFLEEDLDYDYTDTADDEDHDSLLDAEDLEQDFNNFAFTDEISTN